MQGQTFSGNIKYSILVVFLLTPFLVFAHTEEINQTIIYMTDNGFYPKEIQVALGDTVLFENVGIEKHWIASDIHPTHSIYPESDIRKCGSGEPIFDSCEGISSGEKFAFRFEHDGVWNFHDHLNSEFSGTIIVSNNPFLGIERKRAEKINESGKIFINFKIFLARLYYGAFPFARIEKLNAVDMNIAAFEDNNLFFWMSVLGPDAVLDEIVTDAKTDGYIGCHFSAHLAGRMAYEIFEISPFSTIDTRCQSGFFHGLMEAYLGQNGGPEIVSRMAEHCETFENGIDQTRCFHGLGHGFMVYRNYDLPRALEQCNFLKEAGTRQRCYGGVFMENAFTTIDFGVKQVHESKWTSKDMHFPCNEIIMNEGMFYQCYYNQPFIMLQLSNLDYSKVIQECLRAPLRVQHACARGVGFFAAAPPKTPKAEEIFLVCDRFEETEYKTACSMGATEMFAYVWGPELQKENFRFCGQFEKETRSVCTQHISEINENGTSVL
jgi:plastocyanin